VIADGKCKPKEEGGKMVNALSSTTDEPPPIVRGEEGGEEEQMDVGEDLPLSPILEKKPAPLATSLLAESAIVTGLTLPLAPPPLPRLLLLLLSIPRVLVIPVKSTCFCCCCCCCCCFCFSSRAAMARRSPALSFFSEEREVGDSATEALPEVFVS